MPNLPEVQLQPGTAVLCDLHLDLGDVNPSAEFERVLESLHGAPRLVILGDLFDYWVGPGQMKLQGAGRILDALAALTKAGTQLDVLFGNRDFLLDERFVARTGACLRPDGMIGVLPSGARSLLIHGDELCTLDHGYQRLRSVLRSGFVQWLGPRLPLFVSQFLARKLRRASTAALQVKPSEEKRMQRDACVEISASHAAQVVICGHAHEYRDELLENDSRWLVLDAFGGQRDLLMLGSTEWEVRCSEERAKIPR